MIKENPNIIDSPQFDSENEYTFIEGSYFSVQFKILGASFLIAAFKFLLEFHFAGLIFLFSALIFFFAQKGISISFSAENYRNIFQMFGKKWGKWQALPTIEYVSIFTAKKFLTANIGTQSNTASFSEIEVNLCYNKNKKLNVFITDKYDLALEKAKYFSEKFKIDIYDATGKEAKWL